MTSFRRIALIAVVLLAAGFVKTASAQSSLGVFDAQGRFIGLHSGPPYLSQNVGLFSVTTVRGYRVVLFNQVGGGDLVSGSGEAFDRRAYSGVSYPTTDCTGPAYARIDSFNDPLPLGYRASAAIFDIGPDIAPQFWAVHHGAEAVTITKRSQRSGETCSPRAPVSEQVVPVEPNDPDVTGFPNPPLLGPVRLEPVPLSQAYGLFRDGFESALVVPDDRRSGVV